MSSPRAAFQPRWEQDECSPRSLPQGGPPPPDRPAPGQRRASAVEGASRAGRSSPRRLLRGTPGTIGGGRGAAPGIGSSHPSRDPLPATGRGPGGPSGRGRARKPAKEPGDGGRAGISERFDGLAARRRCRPGAFARSPRVGGPGFRGAGSRQGGGKTAGGFSSGTLDSACAANDSFQGTGCGRSPGTAQGSGTGCPPTGTRKDDAREGSRTRRLVSPGVGHRQRGDGEPRLVSVKGGGSTTLRATP